MNPGCATSPHNNTAPSCYGHLGSEYHLDDPELQALVECLPPTDMSAIDVDEFELQVLVEWCSPHTTIGHQGSESHLDDPELQVLVECLPPTDMSAIDVDEFELQVPGVWCSPHPTIGHQGSESHLNDPQLQVPGVWCSPHTTIGHQGSESHLNDPQLQVPGVWCFPHPTIGHQGSESHLDAAERQVPGECSPRTGMSDGEVESYSQETDYELMDILQCFEDFFLSFDCSFDEKELELESEDVISNRLCYKLVSFCSVSTLSAMSPFECIHLFRCLITTEELQAWTRRLNDLNLDTLMSNVRKRINNDISELDFFKNYLGIYEDPKANHRYSRETPQKVRKHAGKAIVFYVLSKFVEDPLSLDDQRRLFDGIITLKDLVSNRDEMETLFEVFRSLRAVGMLLSPDGIQKVFMVIGSMILGDGVFHQRGSHMTKKAKCLEAIVVALIKMFPAERCRKRRRNVDDGSSRSELAEVASAEESAAEPSSKHRRAD